MTNRSCDILHPDPDGTVPAFSWQRTHVIATLQQGRIHRQEWRDSRAYNNDDLNENLRPALSTAFLWITEQYEKLMGRRLQTAPVWVWLSSDNIEHFRTASEERLLELRIPASELLPSDHLEWSLEVTEGNVVGVHEDLCLRGSQCSCSTEYRRASWDRIFCPAAGNRVQAIVDRIEPTWVVNITDPGR